MLGTNKQTNRMRDGFAKEQQKAKEMEEEEEEEEDTSGQPWVVREEELVLPGVPADQDDEILKTVCESFTLDI